MAEVLAFYRCPSVCCCFFNPFGLHNTVEPKTQFSFLAIPVGDALWDCGCSFFFFFLFFPPLLSGPYLWNRYSQRLQIECTAWSCCLTLHYSLPSNSLCYFFFYFFFSAKILSGPYLWNRYSQRLQIECAAWSCGLILHCCLPSNSLCYFFFPATILPQYCLAHISGTVTRRDSKLSVLLGPAV